MACLAKGFNASGSVFGLNLPDKRVDPDCWLRSGFESPWRQLGFKPPSGSNQLRTLHCRATLICGELIMYNHFPILSSNLKCWHFKPNGNFEGLIVLLYSVAYASCDVW